jgi:hypothetical protein
MKTRTVCLGMLIGLSSVAAPDEPPIDAYYHVVNYKVLMCSITYKLARARAELEANGGTPPDDASSADYLGCIAKGKAEIKAAYDKALRMIKKTPAKTALKEHYVAGISALQGIDPQSGETRMNYTKRQGDNNVKLDEMWTRFEAEK